jgi:peptidyl-tRNA hydrolase, PTH2 family
MNTYNYEVKQAIVVRRDLGMPLGKLAAQVAHASMSFISSGLMRPLSRYCTDPYSYDNWFLGPTQEEVYTCEERRLIVDEELAIWLDGAFAKVVLSVNSEEELLAVYARARDAGLRHSLITDEGRTVFNGIPTHTCVGVGPNYIEKVNKVTGSLPLYR